jgi:hypothetical protein
VSKCETCIDCHKQSPETETDYTLISSQFGWRLTRSKGADGGLLLEWRCPACWGEYKRSKPEVATAVHPQPPPAPKVPRPATPVPPPPSSRRRPSK